MIAVPDSPAGLEVVLRLEVTGDDQVTIDAAARLGHQGVARILRNAARMAEAHPTGGDLRPGLVDE